MTLRANDFCTCAERGSKVSNDNIRERLDLAREAVEGRLAVSKVAARKLIEANLALIEAEEYRDAKGNSKAAARHELAECSYNECLKDFISFFKTYEAELERALLVYDEVVVASDARAAKRIRAEAEKFETQQSYMRESVWDSLDSIAGLAEAYNSYSAVRNEKQDEVTDFVERELESVELFREEKAAVEQNFEEPAKKEEPTKKEEPPRNTEAPCGPQGYAPYGAYNPYYPPQQSVSIAPATIDISPIIEEAVAAALNKFKSVFEKRADELAEAESAAIITTDKIVKSESEIAEAEAAIAAKLAEIMGGLKTLVDELVVVGESCEKLIETEKEVAERQRRVNDMQRTLVREMQGVQANQKVITGEQSALTEAQATLAELQAANAENNKLILSAEGEVADMQKSLLAAQSAIGESVREVVNSHKSIIAAEQAIISANAKNIEHQRELAEKQSELATIQKNALAEQKALARKVRSQSKTE